MYLTTKNNSDKTVHNFQLDYKLKDQSGALHSPLFTILHHKSTEWKNYVFRRFFSLNIQKWKDPHNIYILEPRLCLGSFLLMLENQQNVVAPISCL